MRNSTQSFAHDTHSTFLHDFFSNSEASASELLENHEEMFPRYYYQHTDILVRHSINVKISYLEL